ncbi:MULTISPECIES: sigma-70 family RNA polymerase sigma factor [Bacteroidaceae]|uniref:Sigma-70 family RNA polymerase sigma factor n=1 Tax=Bacteroides acidifaciens TaxID=85831 RepID=A0A4S2ANF7_9BACE|nr:MULTISPECIES: sigma-70 family RNA polymerase sigma factor [Bacteroidaceae]MCR1998302.1 sigma-70 family RNA polymerase sigma factor [Bacteroides acidifaciens]TGY02523.1 sigma-70 family RNA polymerase sigma factor [Bacteroides acidifaciens]
MTEQQIINSLIAGELHTIQDFFFVRCKPVLIYIGQYFCQDKQTPEELIGEFYEFLAADDWHKLRIFKYTCTLNSYVTIIASRYFQHKRDKELLSLDENISLVPHLYEERNEESFFMEDLGRIMKSMSPLDRFLVQRILIDGEKPGDVLDEAKVLIMNDKMLSTEAKTDAQFAGYIYTRYNRVRKNLQKQMIAMGYGK